MFGQDRNALREHFFGAWRKHQSGEALEPLEQLIVQVISAHPEYHAVLADPDRYQDRDYLPEMGETNPFLHMAMHIAIHEQLTTQRPPGVVEAYRALLSSAGDPHAAEHRMMDCLAEALWQAQRQGTAPDESRYLACLHQHAR